MKVRKVKEGIDMRHTGKKVESDPHAETNNVNPKRMSYCRRTLQSSVQRGLRFLTRISTGAQKIRLPTSSIMWFSGQVTWLPLPAKYYARLSRTRQNVPPYTSAATRFFIQEYRRTGVISGYNRAPCLIFSISMPGRGGRCSSFTGVSTSPILTFA